MPLTIILPTRGRPSLLVETLGRSLPNISRNDTRLVVAIDDDDDETAVAMEGFAEHSNVVIDRRAREPALSDKWNRAFKYYPADLYMVMADYTAIVTPGFDQKMLDAAALFPDGIGAVFGHMANDSFCCTYGYTHRLCEKLGWMYPPWFPFWFSDHWLDDIARLIGRVAFADVQLVACQNRPASQYYLCDVAFWATFFDGMRLLRRRQALDIIDSPDFEEPRWRKELLRQHHPLHEFRSQRINDYVRGMKRVEPSEDASEEYRQLKWHAVEMMQSEWPALEKELRGE